MTPELHYELPELEGLGQNPEMYSSIVRWPEHTPVKRSAWQVLLLPSPLANGGIPQGTSFQTLSWGFPGSQGDQPGMPQNPHTKNLTALYNR